MVKTVLLSLGATSILSAAELPMEPLPINKGYITDFLQIDLLYGYEKMTLDISNDITDPDIYTYDENGNKVLTKLADGGSYSFQPITLEQKKLNVKISDMVFSYEIKGNTLDATRSDYGDLTSVVPTDNEELLVSINEIMAGFGVPKQTSLILNHTANKQFIYRKAVFSGDYRRDGINETFQMDKDKFSYKVLSQPFRKSNFLRGGQAVWSYWKFDYENSTFPQVIFTLNANGDNLNFVDKDFSSKKYTLNYGQDKLTDNNFILGYQIGLGLSDIELSDEGMNKVLAANVSNLDTTTAINYNLTLRFGYNKTFLSKYTSLSLGVLYEWEYLNESSSETTSEENDNGKAELVYDRAEKLSTLRVNAKWSF